MTAQPTSPLSPDPTSSLTIGRLTAAVTQLTGARCTPAMIYHYERMGLLQDARRTDGGYRLFDIQDVERVACIKRWQLEGMSLGEIRRRLDRFGVEFHEPGVAFTLPDDRRTQILKAATDLFPQKGYDATTLLDIAEKAEVSSATIYQYFRSKEDLFMAIVGDFSFSRLLEQITELLQEEEMTTIGHVYHMLVEVGKYVLEAHAQNPEIHRMFLAESRNFPEIGKQYWLQLITPLEELLEQFIFDPHHNGILRDVDPKLAVRAFYSMFVNFYMTRYLLSGEDGLLAQEEEQIEQLVGIYLDGVLRK